MLISLWAQNQEAIISGTQMPGNFHEEQMVSDSDLPAHEAEVSQLQTQGSRVVSLPKIISASNPDTPLEASSCIRSSRLSNNASSVFYELEANPRKKQRVWREVSQKDRSSLQMLENPPKPTDDAIPGLIPNEILKSWGVLCEVTLEELTNQALLAERNDVVSNDSPNI